MLYIDVSHYDWDRFKGNLDWNQIKANGIDVVFIRASYGDPLIYNPETRYFKEMATKAKEAGLRVGGYHNLIHGDLISIQQQVAYFKEQLDSVQADYAMVDVEPYEALKKNDLWPRLSDAELFAQEFSKQDSRKLAVYLPQWVWSNYLNKADLRPLMQYARGPLVASNYPLGVTKGQFDQLYVSAKGDSGPGWSAYGNVTPEVWQYSSNAIVPGASSTTDVNAYKGTSEEFDARMAWVLTKNLQAFRDQMNLYFPNRDKASDGSIGDAAHASGTSGHNPDDSAYDNAEWDNDSDTKSEVRAIDVDDDLRDSNGVTMEDVLQHLLRLAKSDPKFPIRYMIYNKRIFSSTSGWVQKAYTGSSPHTEHLHLSGAYSDAADENVYNYRLDELVALTTEEITAIANAVWNKLEEDPYDTATPKRQVRAGTWLRYSIAKSTVRDYVQEAKVDILNALLPIAAKVDLEPAEIQAIKDALDVPTSTENAQAVVDELATADVADLADVLRNGMTAEKLAELKAAL